MKLNVQLSPDAAAALHQHGKQPRGYQTLRKRLKALGVELEPLHPGATDPGLMPHFAVELPDDQDLAARVREVLDKSSLVTGTYVKPADELP